VGPDDADCGRLIATVQIDVAGKPKLFQTVDGGVLAELAFRAAIS